VLAEFGTLLSGKMSLGLPDPKYVEWRIALSQAGIVCDKCEQELDRVFLVRDPATQKKAWEKGGAVVGCLLQVDPCCRDRHIKSPPVLRIGREKV
jgi:hypothetical protein